MKTVYLCGPITGLSYGECTDWRQFVARHVAQDIIPLSPLRGKRYLENEKEIGDSYEHIAMSTAQAITTRDRFDLQSCDMMIANFLGAKKVSIGSVIELGWADAFRKPVILVIESENNIHEHSIVNSIAGFRVSTLKEAITIVNATLSMSFAKEYQ